MNLSPELQNAIDAFATWRGELADPREAADECVDASGEFVDLLQSQGIDCSIPDHLHRWAVEPDPQSGIPGMIWLENRWDGAATGFLGFPLGHRMHTIAFHCVVYAEGVCIDWTARQLDSEAPFPLIWVPDPSA